MKQSAWEKLTAGMCNAGFEAPEKRVKTAREIKREIDATKAAERATRKFSRAASMQGKDLRKLSDSWTKRNSTNATGFHHKEAGGAVKVTTC